GIALIPRYNGHSLNGFPARSNGGARMRTRIFLAVGLTLLGSAAPVRSQEVIWRPAKTAQAAAPISLGQPLPLQSSASSEPICQVSAEAPRIGRAQPPPPPPAFPGPPGPPVFPTPGTPGPIGADAYNKGVVNNDADINGFWSRVGDKFRRCWDDV